MNIADDFRKAGSLLSIIEKIKISELRGDKFETVLDEILDSASLLMDSNHLKGRVMRNAVYLAVNKGFMEKDKR